MKLIKNDMETKAALKAGELGTYLVAIPNPYNINELIVIDKPAYSVGTEKQVAYANDLVCQELYHIMDRINREPATRARYTTESITAGLAAVISSINGHTASEVIQRYK